VRQKEKKRAGKGLRGDIKELMMTSDLSGRRSANEVMA
jgi:hypothetical protein